MRLVGLARRRRGGAAEQLEVEDGGGEGARLGHEGGGADDVAMPELPAPTPWFSPADLELDGGERALSLASSAEWEKSLTDAKRSAQRAKSLAEELASKTPR